MPHTKINSSNLQRAITPKIDRIELWFMYTDLVLNVIYLCVKFEVTSFYTLEVMPQTKIHGKNLQMAINRLPTLSQKSPGFYVSAVQIF